VHEHRHNCGGIGKVCVQVGHGFPTKDVGQAHGLHKAVGATRAAIAYGLAQGSKIADRMPGEQAETGSEGTSPAQGFRKAGEWRLHLLGLGVDGRWDRLFKRKNAKGQSRSFDSDDFV